MSAKVYENGAWRDINQMNIYENGAWRNVNSAKIYENGAWREVYPTIAIDVSSVAVGDEVVIPHSIYGNIPFIVIGKNHDASNSVTLLTKEIVRCLAFDAKEPTNSNSNRQSNGNSNYRYSNILQWMNSTKAAGEWYTAQHTYDQAPTGDYVTYTPYSEIDGLLRGFDSSVINQMITVSKRTAIPVTDGGGYDDVSSKIFLLCWSEIYADAGDKTEGSVYEYFSSTANYYASRRSASISDIAYDTTSYRSTDFKRHKDWYWMLRGNRGASGLSIVDNNDGYMDTYTNSCVGWVGLRFALVLKST